jgi:porin
MMAPTLKRFGGLAVAVAMTASALAAAEESAEGPALAFDYTGEAFANVDGGVSTGSVYSGLAQLSLQLERGEWATHADLYAPHGGDLSEERVGDFSVLSNIVAVHQVRLHEAWLQRTLGGLSLRGGILAADTEFWGDDDANVFISSAFGAPSVISGNLPNPAIFPQGVLGARAAFDLGDAGTWRVAVLDGDGGDPASENRHGLDISLGQGALLVAEYERQVAPESGGKNHVRIGAFYHTGDFVTRDGGSSSGNLGFLGVLDHAVDERLSLFARAGFAQRDRSTVPWSVEAGLNVAPAFGAHDRLGLAVAWVDLASLPDATAAPSGLRREAVLEGTLQWPLGETVAIQPDVQYIVDPGGTEHARNALVVGLRVSVHL